MDALRAGMFRARAQHFVKNVPINIVDNETELQRDRQIKELQEQLAEAQGQIRALMHTVSTGMLGETEEPDDSKQLRYPSVNEIIKTVAVYFGVKTHELKAHRRHSKLVYMRQIGFYLACHMTMRSLPFIGRQFGEFDHTTVLHARNKIETNRLKDQHLCHDLVELEMKILELVSIEPAGGKNAAASISP